MAYPIFKPVHRDDLLGKIRERGQGGLIYIRNLRKNEVFGAIIEDVDLEDYSLRIRKVRMDEKKLSIECEIEGSVWLSLASYGIYWVMCERCV